MILEAGRDTAAMFALDELLSRTREIYLELALSGQTPDEEFWSVHEKTVAEDIKRRFYNHKVCEAVKARDSLDSQTVVPPLLPQSGPSQDPSTTTEQVDFDQHGQKLVEHAIWMTHEIIKQIPCVGLSDDGERQ
ncbi:MAG: hypothetical protein WBG37_14400 [Desulfobacterales bacterium]